MKIWKIEKLNDIPKRSDIHSVYLLPFTEDGKIVITKNERGWDVIGGHIESTDESVLDSLKRESLEEASLFFNNVKAFLVLQFPGADNFMLFHVSNDLDIRDFVSEQDDVLDRDVVSVKEFLHRYYGDKDLMAKIVASALASI